jgi:hypothetical protein
MVLINPNHGDYLPRRRSMPERLVALTGSVLANDARMRILDTGSPQECGEAAFLHVSPGNSAPI